MSRKEANSVKHKIAINRKATGKLPEGDPGWATFNDDFENVEREVIELANDIYLGHAYTTWMSGRRSLENFILAQHFAIDMDSDDERSHMDTLLQHDLVQMYASLIHTTPSHTPQTPRARIIFLLDEPITDPGGYQAAAKFLAAQFDGADPVCTDASRFFYGSFDCDIWLSMNVLPLRQLRHFYKRWARTHKVGTQVPTQVPTIETPTIKLHEYRQNRNDNAARIDALVEPVRVARQGARNVTLNRQAFLAGMDMRAGKLTESEIVPLLLDAARAAGLEEKEAMKTIQSAMRGAQKAAL